jgi:hypothetical protein
MTLVLEDKMERYRMWIHLHSSSDRVMVFREIGIQDRT